ncbi:hypothetical protein [Xanthocytophaga flava]|uniref:hypothetical protein n=1 Tax=Xanthocytophaga flava TaxID=3048013 RepID=UPI0028D42F0E|nr:hypothetical protein [Xanthocytophaga flavus]MDJ1472546.1 hypothetical protein [Xanthocytophaga flavus]
MSASIFCPFETLTRTVKSIIFCCLACSFFTIGNIVKSQTPDPLSQNSNPSSPENYRKAVETFARLDQSNNFTESLSYADMNTLPMGIKQTISNIQVTIAVSDIRWETNYSELTLFAKVKIPQESKPLFFGAQGIKLSHNGDIIGDASLVLMGDISIPINGSTAALTLKGGFDIQTGRAKELTYVSVDCQGFKEMGISADVEFPESILTPVNEKGEPISGRVKGSFKTVVKDWNDLLVGISLPPFEIKGLNDFTFMLGEAIFDFSDLRNDPSIVYPQGYELNYMIPGNPTLWRGIFVRDLVVTLPKQFSKRGKERVSFGAKNMLIDNNGISGTFAATNILPLKEGSASGWQFSVDRFSLALEANRLTEAGFSGMIGLPVSENSTLGYDAIITADNEYLLKVKPVSGFKFDVFKAEAQLLPNSYVALQVVDGKFKPEAMLHGSLNLAARLDGGNPQDSSGKKVADFKGIEFRSLHLKTDAPRFTAEYFGYKGELKMMNFPISVDRIGLRVSEKEVALGFDIKLTLSDNMFAGSTRLELIGAMNEKQEGNEAQSTQQWKYKKLNISNIAINAKVAETFNLKAELSILRDDPTYGDGFAGNVELTFDKVLKGCNINARAMFGRKDFRYWFVDGRVKFGSGIPVFPPLNLNGFGGGVSYRMKRDGADLLSSPTGCKYVPDENSGIGAKAAVLFNVANDAAINGEASFEIAFNKSGGINFIGFYGFAKFVGKIPGVENIENFVGDKFKKVAELEKKFVGDNTALAKSLETLKQYEPNKAATNVFQPSETPGQAGFSAAMGIQYDFTQSSLHATFDLYVNAAGGIIRGTASGNRAGWAVLHIDPKEWYVHMGTPTDRLGLKMGIGGISVETGSYLMLGSRIPGSPPPPKEVADILGVDMAELDYMRDLNALGDGKGFAFGSSLKVATGDLSFLILYANFQAGLGFDIMLKDYQDMQCQGRSGKIGIDGWYANGQSYVYLQGELGVKVNLWFLKTKIPIIKGSAAALMQAKLPNPTFVKGYLGVQFDLLGGLVRGKCRFKITLGEECELVVPGGSPLDMRMISDLTPKNNSDAVDVFAAPQAAFNMRVGVPFDVEDDQGPKTYRIQLTSFTVQDAGQAINGKLLWTDNKDGVSFLSHEVLPPNKPLKAVVKVGFEQLQNGRWVVVYTSGQKAEETMEVAFKTGTAPTAIPLQNVEFAYPVIDQKFFLKDESKGGIVQLKRGQSYLFSPDYKHEIHVTKSDGTKQTVAFTYNPGNNQLTYQMPELVTQQAYSVSVVTLAKEGSGQTTESVDQRQAIGGATDDITVANAQANNVIRSDIGQSLLDYSFATSRYTTFSQKMEGNPQKASTWERVSSTVINLAYELTVTEPFEPIELRGSEYTAGRPLIEGASTLTDTYYQSIMYPLLYKNYPLAGIVTLTHRDPSMYGVPPAKAIDLLARYLTEVENDKYTGYASRYFPYTYALFQVYQRDFYDLQNQLVNRYINTNGLSQFSNIVNGVCPSFTQGTYTVKFQYILPDGTKGTSANFDYINNLK